MSPISLLHVYIYVKFSVWFYNFLCLTCTIISSSAEGIPDLLLLLVRWVPEIMTERLTYVDNVEVCSLATTLSTLLLVNLLLNYDNVNIVFYTFSY